MKKFQYWTPRVLGLFSILFFTLFSLDTFGRFSGSELLLTLLIHSIPALMLIAMLILAWKRPLLGGALFMLGGIASLLFFHSYESVLGFLIISFPVLLSGILFLIEGRE